MSRGGQPPRFLTLAWPEADVCISISIRSAKAEEPARTARRVVTWYAERPRIGLWVLLMTSPFAALVLGCAILWRQWKHDDELRQALVQSLATFRQRLPTLLVAGATLTAAVLLAIVTVHSLLN